MMGSNEHISAQEKLKTLRKLGVSEAGIKRAEQKLAPPAFFSHRINIGTEDEEVIPYDGHGVLVAPHAPSREECNKRLNNRTYRLLAEKRLFAEKKYKESR